MLTKNDLTAIKNIVSEEVRNEFVPINGSIKELSTSVSAIQKDIKPIKKELKKIRKDLNAVITRFDVEITDTVHRVDRIETHLHLTPAQIN